MTNAHPAWRSRLARELTRRFRLTASEAMQMPVALIGSATRIGITGPPGAGKSSLIAGLAGHWLDQGMKVGILAIDPTSPLSGGAVLGDRVRMEEVAMHDNIYIRSVPSGPCNDGLCPNILLLLEAYEEAGFDRIILETVGVGQVSYAARMLVDTFALTLNPESGDTVQAMKAGILETADLYIVNKCDLDGADRLASELRSITRWRDRSGGWSPPVISVSTKNGRGFSELADAAADHGRATMCSDRSNDLLRARRHYAVRSLTFQRLDQLLSALPEGPDGESNAFVPATVMSELGLLS